MQNILRNRNTLAIRYDKNTSSLHCYYKFSKRNCYTLELLKDVEDFHNSIFTFFKNNKDNSDIKFIVYRSQVDGIFSYGGDLEFFLDKIEKREHNKLLEYGKLVTDTIVNVAQHFNLPVITVMAIDGDAFGGGFELALSGNISIATKRTSFSIPDSKLNLFPGGGAFTFLKKLIGEKKATRIILSGDKYSAQEIYDMGIIDFICQDGDLDRYLNKFLKHYNKNFNAIYGIQQTKDIESPIEYDKLIKIVNVWAKSISNLTPINIKKIRKIVSFQYSKNEQESIKIIRTTQDRRISDSKNLIFPLKTPLNTVFNDRRVTMRRRA